MTFGVAVGVEVGMCIEDVFGIPNKADVPVVGVGVECR